MNPHHEEGLCLAGRPLRPEGWDFPGGGRFPPETEEVRFFGPFHIFWFLILFTCFFWWFGTFFGVDQFIEGISIFKKIQRAG